MPCVVVARQREPADADVAVVAVVGHVEAADAAQEVGERPIAVPRDVLGGDDGDRGRRFGHRLHPLGGAEDGLDLEPHQVFETHLREVLRGRSVLLGRHGASGCGDEREKGHRDGTGATGDQGVHCSASLSA